MSMIRFPGGFGSFSSSANAHRFSMIHFVALLLTVVVQLQAGPTIMTQPQSASVHFGGTMTFTVSAVNAGNYEPLWPLSYQWMVNNVAIAGATNTSYTTYFCQSSNGGNYSVVVSGYNGYTNAFMSVLSSNAQLTVTTPTYPATNVLSSCDFPSLKAAVANGGVVEISCNGTIQFPETITISNDVILDATGHSIILDGGGSNRLFIINSNVTATLINVTLANGGGSGVASGGAISSYFGSVTLKNCILTNNTLFGHEGGSTPMYGGGSFALPGEFAKGGAVYSLGVLSIDSCTFYSNRATGGQGGFGTYDGGVGGLGEGARFVVPTVAASLSIASSREM